MTVPAIGRMAEMRTAVALLGLPVELDVDDAGAVVVRMPRDLNTVAEVQVLRVVELYAPAFRREAV